jgi:hypothetical protein
VQPFRGREDEEGLASAGASDLPAQVRVAHAGDTERRSGRNRIVDRLSRQPKQEKRFAVVVLVDDVQIRGHGNAKPVKELIAGRDAIAGVQPCFRGAAPTVDPGIDLVRRGGGCRA